MRRKLEECRTEAPVGLTTRAMAGLRDLRWEVPTPATTWRAHVLVHQLYEGRLALLAGRGTMDRAWLLGSITWLRSRTYAQWVAGFNSVAIQALAKAYHDLDGSEVPIDLSPSGYREPFHIEQAAAYWADLLRSCEEMSMEGERALRVAFGMEGLRIAA